MGHECFADPVLERCANHSMHEAHLLSRGVVNALERGGATEITAFDVTGLG